MGIILSISNGLLVALVTVFLKLSGSSSGFSVFVYSCLILALVHISVAPMRMLNGSVFTKPNLARGVILATTQFFICLALEHGTAASALIAGTFGSIFGIVLGRMVLKDVLVGKDKLGITLAVIGSLLNPNLFTLSGFAVIGGILQGINGTLTSHIARKRLPAFDTVGSTFVTSGLFGLVLLLAWEGNLTSVPYTWIIVFSLCLVLIHYLLCHAFRYIDSQRGMALGLVRIPASIGLEWSIFKVTPRSMQVLSALLISVGILLLTFSSRRKSKSFKI